MGRPPTGERQYAIETMWNVHHEIVRLAVMGFKQVDIANQLNISEVTVSYTLNSPIVKRKLDCMHAARDLQAIDVAKQIQALAPKAIEAMEVLLESDVASVKLRAAVDILDRAGHGAVKKEMSLVGHLGKEDIEEIKARARATGLCRPAIDITQETKEAVAI